VGNKIAKQLSADIEEIVDLKSRKDVISWAESAFNSEIRKPTKIKAPKKNPMDYDLVVVGTPIWDGVVPAVKAYLKQMEFPKNVAFFSTFGASAENAFEVMGKLSKRKPLATLGLQDRQIILKEDKELVQKFADKVKKKVKK
jgi:flavodoxin